MTHTTHTARKTASELTIGDRVAVYDGTRNYERRLVTVTSSPHECSVVGFLQVDTDERPISGGPRDMFEVEVPA